MNLGWTTLQHGSNHVQNIITRSTSCLRKWIPMKSSASKVRRTLFFQSTISGRSSVLSWQSTKTMSICPNLAAWCKRQLPFYAPTHKKVQMIKTVIPATCAVKDIRMLRLSGIGEMVSVIGIIRDNEKGEDITSLCCKTCVSPYIFGMKSLVRSQWQSWFSCIKVHCDCPQSNLDYARHSREIFSLNRDLNAQEFNVWTTWFLT